MGKSSAKARRNSAAKEARALNKARAESKNSNMMEKSKEESPSEPADTTAKEPIEVDEIPKQASVMSEIHEIKHEKEYERRRKDSHCSTLLFERAMLKEAADGDLVLQSLVAKLEERFGLTLTDAKLKSLISTTYLDADHCSVFGPRTHISRLIQNEVESLYATNKDEGKARAVLLQLWDKRIVAAASDSRRRQISTEALDIITGSNRNDSLIMDKYEELKEEHIHEAVAYLLHSRKMLSASIEAIELLLEHKLYWDAAVLARRYLTPSNETFKKVFTEWAHAFIEKGKSGSIHDKKGNFMIDAAKCYIMLEEYGLAANLLIKSDNLKLLLLACRLSRIDVKVAELRGDSKAIEMAKLNASQVANIAVRHCVITCEWEVATALCQFMQLDQTWSLAISMHQALLLRVRPLLGQSRLHHNEHVLLRIHSDVFPSLAMNTVNSGAFIKGVWEHWKETISVDDFDKHAANALILKDVDGISHGNQRHWKLFDIACQLVTGLMQAASDLKDLAQETFTTLLENCCNNFAQIEAELKKIFTEISSETSDDKALESIIEVVTTVMKEREKAVIVEETSKEEVEEKKEKVVEEIEGKEEGEEVVEKEESSTEGAAVAADDAVADVVAVDDEDKPHLPDTADGDNEVNSVDGEHPLEQIDVAGGVDDAAEAISVLEHTEIAKDDSPANENTSADPQKVSPEGSSDLQGVEETEPSTDPIMSAEGTEVKTADEIRRDEDSSQPENEKEREVERESCEPNEEKHAS